MGVDGGCNRAHKRAICSDERACGGYQPQAIEFAFDRAADQKAGARLCAQRFEIGRLGKINTDVPQLGVINQAAPRICDPQHARKWHGFQFLEQQLVGRILGQGARALHSRQVIGGDFQGLVDRLEGAGGLLFNDLGEGLGDAFAAFYGLAAQIDQGPSHQAAGHQGNADRQP